MAEEFSFHKPGFTHLPEELLLLILSFLPATSLAACERLNIRLSQIVGDGTSILWRRHCRSTYQFWSAQSITQFNSMTIFDWKQQFKQRLEQDRLASRNFESMLASQARRIQRADEIVSLGCEAKDYLLPQLRCPQNLTDVLARQYFAGRTLGTIERSIALKEWQHVAYNSAWPLERALAAFDLFFIEAPPLTIEEVEIKLDDLAKDFQEVCSGEDKSTLRRQSLALVAYLRHRGFRAASSGQFYNIRNSSISVCLLDAQHCGLPLITVAIFCCVARRLGINAQPVQFPGQVHALVAATAGQTLDGELRSLDVAPDIMYINPSEHASEVPLEHLEQTLKESQVPARFRSECLLPCSTVNMVLRTANNIDQALRRHEVYQIIFESPSETEGVHDLHPATLNPRLANYAVKWANLLLGAPRGATGKMCPHILNNNAMQILGVFEDQFPEDAQLIIDHAMPLFTQGEALYQLEEILNGIYDKDAVVPIPKRRLASLQSTPPAALTQGAQTGVRYRVGQLFQHARFHYQGAIYGWDERCRMSEIWIRSQGVDNLPNGRRQPFYRVLAEDGSERYVAEENILVVDGETTRAQGRADRWTTDSAGLAASSQSRRPGDGLLRTAGKYFKRWCTGRETFVSNVKDGFPDD